jgi:hypothetical protein
MKTLFTLAVSLVGLSQLVNAQDLYVSKNSEVSFFSSTPVEDINAHSKTAVSALNIKTGQIFAKVENTSFAFKAKLMEEHFNENYMESDKYPYSSFDGKILEIPALHQTGTYHVTVLGKLTMHGVTKEYKVPAVLTYQDGRYSAVSTFKVKLVDHHIEVPSLMFSKIAEEIEIKIKTQYQAKQLASIN